MEEAICLWIDVQDVIAKLTERQRRALMLWLTGYTQEEIAQREGISQRAVSWRIDACLDQIRRSMTPGTTKIASF